MPSEEKIVEEAKNKLNAGLDNGHNLLMEDIKELLNEAVSFEFHDFLNTKHPAPKWALASFLHKMVERTESGQYDN